MLADTAVAVHPDDERYRHLIGKTAVLPLVGPPPADHRRRLRQDRLRHRRAEDHARPRPQRLRDRPPPRARRDLGHRRGRPHDGRGRARLRRLHRRARRATKVVAALDASRGCIRHTRALHPHRALQPPLGRAHRAADLAAVVHGAWTSWPRRRSRPSSDGRVRIHPESQSRRYLEWLRNIRPWCISRQLWWGHQIPVWYRDDEETYVGLEPPEGAGLGARPRRARHLVLLGAVAVRDARLARGDARAARLLPDRRALDGARHPLPVGRAHGDDGPRVHRRRSRSPTSTCTRSSRRPTGGG